MWPFPYKQVEEAVAEATRVLVPEMNLGQVAGEVEKVTRSEVIRFNQVNGEVIGSPALVQEIRRLLP